MGSGGKGPLAEATRGLQQTFRDWGDDFLGKYLETGVDLNTAGLLKYNPTTGKWREGHNVRNTDESIGEISGRNKQRIANYLAEEGLEESQKQNQAIQANMRLQNYRADVAASLQGEAVRKTSQARSADRFRPLSSLGDDQDYLGL